MPGTRNSSFAFLRDHCFLAFDSDGKFTRQFRETLKHAGARPIPTPEGAPDCNAFAERFVLSIKSGCLSEMISFGEASLRRAMKNDAAHCHAERGAQNGGGCLSAALPGSPVPEVTAQAG